jgi:hypothetical protein
VSETLGKERESGSDALDTLLVQRRAYYSVFEAILLLLLLLLLSSSSSSRGVEGTLVIFYQIIKEEKVIFCKV